MVSRSLTWRFASLGLLLLAGCLYHVREKIDTEVCDLSTRPWDMDQAPHDRSMPAAADSTIPGGISEAEVRKVSHEEVAQAPADTDKPEPKKPDATKPGGSELAQAKLPPSLVIPRDLLPPGVEATKLPPVPELPDKMDPAEKKAIRKRILRPYLTPLESIGPNPEAVPGPGGKPVTLAQLQQMALSTAPQIRQAVAAVEAARGAALQAGLPPNPTFGYEGDTAGTTGGAGYQGAFIDQVIRTANKLQLARAVATMDLRNAEIALRRAQMDLATRVRQAYFAILVAQENMRIHIALVRFTTAVYEFQFDQVAGGIAAAYEPLYLRMLAQQVRGAIVQARNAYVSAWVQMAAAVGTPGMPRYQLAGTINIPIPVFDYKAVMARVLQNHTDVLSANVSLYQARLSLKQAQVQPIPDVDVRFLLQKDYTGFPFELAHSLQVSMPIPVWNRNQGGIIQAQANLVQQSEEPHRVRTNLTSRLAIAFQAYRDNFALLHLYRDHILPDQVTVYQNVLRRYWNTPNLQAIGPAPPPALPMVATSPLNLGDVVVAQQLLATAVENYISTLGALWQAVVNVTDLMQTPDMFTISAELTALEKLAPIPGEVGVLKPLPCDHPCSPIPKAFQAPPQGSWPQALPYNLGPTRTPLPPTEPAPMPRPVPPDQPAPKPPLTPAAATSSEGPKLLLPPTPGRFTDGL